MEHHVWPPWARRRPGTVRERWLPPPGGDAGSRSGLPWLSTLAVTVFVLVGSGFAGHDQPGRVPLDGFARALLVVGAAPLLFRHRCPRTVALGTAVTTAVCLAAGYPYGPVLVTLAFGAFAAIVAGYRGVAWCGPSWPVTRCSRRASPAA
ncbi:hypothetical protein ACFW81_20995 [Streptomyces angustmyceticus]|uniref:hypothetical protein n=1 Tax=Streptomyces angustmyceticus TaxID=285578 RepID=UPI0036742BC3